MLMRSAPVMILRLLLCVGLVTGCSSFPKDADGTLDRVAHDRVFRVGLIAGDRTRDVAAPFVRAVEAESGARATIVEGAAEPLLLALEDGRIDLVLGETAKESPWQTEVAFLDPLHETPDEQKLQLAPIARNGENAWIMLLERAGKKMRGGA